ncbi:hypothetical protein [Klebsiella pneumoniae]|uniref:hypothetical protein n=1 Tax=Klebsiella pneumoniae TaxID=573 RepID=UPI001D1982A5|nr:hypothetical protein [Klebsiella pneumoniae]
MELKKLDDSFYIDNPIVIQALDFSAEANEWMSHDGKVRGHGIVQIAIGDLTFAIPVRSNIKHDASSFSRLTVDETRVSRYGVRLLKSLAYTKIGTRN